MKKLILILIAVASMAGAEVRQVKPNYHLLPPIKQTPETVAERVEKKAKRAAVAERQKALLELAEIAGGGKGETAKEILKQVEKIREKTKELKKKPL